jgi:hypothetical protein
MTTYEYRIIVNEELYTNNPEEILHEVRNMAFGNLTKELKSVDREKMELVLGSLDEKTMSRTITVTYRGDAPEEPATHVCGEDDDTYCDLCEFHCDSCKELWEKEQMEVEAII